jgi:hypothetical protein
MKKTPPTSTDKDTTALMQSVSEKATLLSQQHACKVHPLVFKIVDSEETVIGYLKEPPREVKLRMMDKGISSPITAASEVLDAYLIKSESDPRIYTDGADNDKYYIGATMEAYDLVKIAVNQFKKK